MPDTPPLLDQFQLDDAFSKYTGSEIDQKSIPSPAFRGLDNPSPEIMGAKPISALDALTGQVSNTKEGDGKLGPGGRTLSMGELQNAPFHIYDPSLEGTDENMLAANQSTWDKAANGLIKMAGVATNTAISTTLGTINGLGEWINTGKFSSFYNNDLTQALDKQMQDMEKAFPHYKTAQQRSEDWYQPSNLFSANFIWDSVVKNLGFSLGASIPALGIAKALNALKLSSRLFAAGEALSATETIEAATQLPRIQQLGYVEGRLSSIVNNIKTGTGNTLKALGAEQVGGAEQTGRLVQGIASALSSSGEASLEAYNNLNEFRNKKIDQYKNGYVDETGKFIAGHGVNPTGQDLQAINDAADGVGNWSYGLNVALLTGTEYVQLPKIWGSTFKGEKNLLNRTVQNAETGLWESALPQRGIAKFIKKTTSLASLGFNEAEAFGEGAQYTIQTGTQHYFDKKYRGKDSDFLTSLGYGVGQATTTAEGLENIFLGGFSGALMTSGFISSKGIGKTGKIGERGWTGYGGEKADNTDKFLKGMNDKEKSFTNYLKDGVDQANRAITIQEQRTSAIRQGDILESKDLEFDYSHNYLSHRVKWGRYDLIEADIEDARQQAATPAGFAALQQAGKASETDTQQTFLKRLNNFEVHAKNVKEQYERVNLKYGGLIDKETKQPVYSPVVLDKMVYAASKVKDYDQRIPELAKDLLAVGIQVQQVLEEQHALPISERTNLQGKTAYEKAIITSQNDEENPSPLKQAEKEINALDVNVDTKQELLQKLNDIKELSVRRKDFIDEYNSIQKAPELHKEVEVKPSTAAQKPTVEVKTKDGIENIEVGTEYYLGKVVETSPEGKEVYRFPTLTILGENADGTIKIKDGNGQIRDVSKSVLEDYKLGKVSDTVNNKKAKFFMDNANTIFQFNFGKGKKVNGRLQYSPKEGILHFVYKNEKGKTKYLEVTGDQFVAKKGYSQAMISPVGKLSVGQQQSLEEFSKEKDSRINAKRSNRLEIIGQLIDENNKKLEELNRKIFAKKEKLAKAAEDIAELATFTTKDKYGKVIPVPFNKVLQRSVSALTDLSSLKTSLEKEIEELQAYKDELEFNGTYFDELVQSIDELPTDSKEFLQELKDQYDAIINQSLSVGEQINAFTKLIDDIKNIIKELTSFLQSAFTKFDRDYPDEIRNSLKDDEEIFKSPQDLKNYIADYTLLKDLKKDINLNEEKISPIVDKINDLYKELSQLEKEASAKWEVLNKFQQAVEEFKKQETIKKEFIANKQVQETYFAQQKANEQNAGTPTEQYDGKQEPPKKDLVNALQSSTDPKWTANTADDNFHRRHQTFLFNQTSTNPKLFSQEEYKGVKVKDRMKILPVTSVTAEQLGFPKDWIPEQYRYNGSNAATAGIYYVYVIEEGDKLFYSDINGNKLSDVASKEALNPSVLIYSNAESAKSTEGFTNKDDLNKEEVLKQWLNVREQIFKLSAESAQNSVQNFRVSRGFPNKTEGVSRNTNVVDAELVTENDLATNVVIQVPTVSSKFPVGVPLLNFNGNTVFLNNRNFSKEEATNIVDVLTYAASHKEGLTNEIFNYLRNVLYFSTDAKGDVKRNQIFLKRAEDQAPVLVVGVNQVEIPFNIDGLTNNREELIRVVENMYHHVNNTSLLALKDKPNTPFIEIGVNEKGDLYTKKEYPSYQHYLLQGANAPLTANIAIPQNGEPSIKEKYSIVSFSTYDPTKFKKPATPAPTPAKSSSTIVKDGSTVNTALTSKGEPVSFTVDAEGKISVIPNEQLQTIFDRLIAAGDTEEVAQAKIMNVAFNAVEESSKKPASAPIITGSASSPTGLVYDGVTKNLAKSSKGEPVEFTVNADNNIEVIPSDSVANIYARLTEAGLSDADARQAILGVAINAVVADKQAEKAKVEEAQAEVVALEETSGVSGSALKDVVPVFHHTKVDVKDFDFGNFQRGKNQVSQFGDGLAVSTDTTPFLQKRYGNPIKGEVKDSDFVVIDTNKTEKEIYEELKSKGYKFNKPDGGSYIGNDPAKEYDGTEKANEQPAIISLFNDFQKSNPEVKGVKIVNHIIANEKVSPFYVIYDNKSFYGEGSLKAPTQYTEAAGGSALKDVEGKKADIERLEKEKQETLQPLIEEKEQIEKEIEEIEKNDDGSVKQEAETIDDFLKNNNITEQQLKDEENKLKNHLDELGLKLDTEYNFEDIINRIIKNVKGRFLKTVLKGINSLVGNKLKTKFVFSSVRHEDAAGQYFSHDDTIKIYIPNLSLRVFTLNKRGKEYQQETNIVEVFNKVFIHELIHAFTILKIRATETNAKLGLATIMNPSIEKERLNISRSDQKTIDSLNKIFDFLKDNELLKGEYGVSDIVEIVTEALSNEGFAEKLKSIELPKELRYKTGNNNVFENIILYISKLVEDLLNLGSAYSDDNALDSIAAIINDFGNSYSESDQQSFMKINKAEERAREYFKYGKSNQSDNLGSETTKLQQLKQKLAEVNKKIDEVTKRFDAQIAQKQSELKALEEQSTSAKKADIERRRQEVERLSNKELTSPTGKINTGKIEIPILPSQNIDKTIYKDNKGVEYKVKANFKNLQDVLLGRNGKYLFRGMQGRFFVLAKVGDFYLPFYISSAGTSGKKQGEWYPFFGYTGNWLVKGRVGNKGEMEYSQKISEVQKLLQENLQFPSRFLNLKGEMKVGDNVIYDINQDFNYIEHFTTFGDGTVKREGDKYPILKETLWIQEITGFDPRNVDNDGKGSADAWINDVIALTENAPLASKGKINAKYDAELATLDNEETDDLEGAVAYTGDVEHRLVFNQWNKYEGNKEQETADVAQMLPKVNVKMVDHLIKTSGGGQAWGAARSAIMEIFKDAPFGTKYHEAFEQVFNWILPIEDQLDLVKEFNQREGTFTTFKGETKKFADATFKEAKEQMAEEFIEYKQSNTTPKASNKIVQFFKDLWNLIKEFLNAKPATLASVFDKLNKGVYRMAPINTAKGIEYRERNVQGEAVSFVNTVLAGMTADMFIDKWKNDVSLIMDLEEKPGYAETELFNNLLARLTDYYENNQNSAGVIAYYAKLLKEVSTPKEKEDVLEQYNAIKQAWKRVKGQWVNYTADLKTFLKVFDVAFQVDDEGNLDLAADLDNGDEKNQKEYVDDKMSVNAKNSASKVVKLLLATISDSEFVKKTITNSLQTRGNDFAQVQPIRNNVMRMRMLAPYAKLFNYILYNTANIPGIYNIVDKLQDLSANTNLKQNANVKSLLNRIKYNPEKGFEGLSIPEIKLLLKLENALSKNKPTFIRQEVTEDGKTVLKHSNIYDRVSQVSEQWNNGLKSLKYTTVSGDNIQFSKGILAADPYIFLSHLNIPLTKGSFPIAKEKELIEQIDAIKGVVQKYIDNPLPLTTKGKSVGIDSRINKLAKFYVENVEGESTESQHLNMAGKVTSNFVLPNFISHILSDTNIAPTLERFIELNPQYKDLYMGASYFLNNIMYKNGVRNKSLSVVVVEGKNIQNEGRPTDKMNEGERMLYEINNNLNGYYYSLMPSDSKLEYALNTGNVVDESFFNSQGKVKATSNYVDAMYASFLNEVELMKDYKNRTNIEALNRKQDGVEIGKQLRFFKYILSPSNANKVESGTTISKEEFASDLLAFVDKQAKQNIEDLSSWGLIEKGEYSDGNPYNIIHGVDANFMKKNFNKNSKAPYISNSELLELYTFREMNYIFNNIEMHRLIFNDPAQYKDQLKAIRSFTSGREYTHVDILNDQKGLNDALKNTLNKGLKPTDIGWTNFKNYLNSVTINNIFTVSKEYDTLKKYLGKYVKKYGEMDIADGQSWAHGNAYREILYKSGGRFTAQQEELHQWLMAWERRDKNKYSSEELRKSDDKILEKPIPSSDKHIMYILKPIVSGTKLVNGVAVQYLYKTSTAPLYAYFVKGTPLEQVHSTMTEKNIDFLAMQSVVKRAGVLKNNIVSLFDKDGNLHLDFKTVTPTPIDYKYFGIQVDTASKKESQTQGSQLTKLATVDLMLAGVPIDFINKHNTKSQEDIQELWEAVPDKTTESKVWSLVKDHKDVLIALAIKRGEKVFNKLGIKEGEFGFTFRDKAIVADFLLQELESRELPSNIKDGVWVEYNPDTDSKEFKTPLEANVNYQKIKQILWSVIEKGVTRPKMPGGPKVQMSVAGMGNIKEVVINGKKAYVDDTLKYYGIDENGDTTPCEIDLPYFFGEQLRESLKAKGKTFKNDDEFFSHILNYLNNTKDGQSLLQGIGFRIPTQRPNSIEYFKVRKFLAPQLGDVVVLPAEITTKAGSDFDVDKLNTYLKNWYIGKSGYPKVIKLQSLSADDTQKLTDLYEYTLKNKRKEWEKRQPINDLMNDIFPSKGEENDYVPSLEEFLADAKGKSSLELNSIEALENHYIETLEKLMALPESFKSLVTPNDASQLETLSAKIQELTNNIDVDINPGHLISSNFMAKKRNTMLASKGSVGISAVSATNQAINQLYNTTMSIPKKIAWRNVAVRFPHNTINNQISLSGIYTKSGDNISDINSQFTDGSVDVAKKEWLPRLGFTDAVISTALLMNKWGTPIEHIAYFINQPAIQAYLKAIEKNKVISKYIGKKEKQNTKIQDEVGAMFSKDKIARNRKNKPSEYLLNGDGKQAGMADMIGKKEFSKAEGILQLQMLDDFIAYQTMAYELLAVVQGYNYDTARITSPEDMYKKEMDEAKAEKSSVNSIYKIMDGSYVGKVAEVAKKINKALKTLINTQSGEAGSIIRAMAFDLKKHFGIGNNADNYSKYMNKAEAAMIDYIVQNKARIKGLPLNTYTSALLSSAYSSAQYIQKLKQDINNNPTHPLVNNSLLKNFITDIDLTKKKPSTVSIAEPDFDTFTSDSYTDQFRELLSSAATVEIPGVTNSNRTVADVFQSLIVAQILQNGSSRKKGSFFHLIPNEVYAEYAAPILQKIEADLDWFYNQGLFYRNNYKDSKLVPYLRPDLVTMADEIVHDTKMFNGKQIFFVNSSNYYSFPFVKITNRAEGTTRLFKRIDSVDADGNKSPVIVKRPEDEEPDGKLINKVAYQEVNILGDGNKAQEYYEDKLTSLYNPHITEIPDYQLIAEMEKSLGSNNIKYESAPLLSEGEDVSLPENDKENIESETSKTTQDKINDCLGKIK